jgi:hypothetical protein
MFHPVVMIVVRWLPLHTRSVYGSDVLFAPLFGQAKSGIKKLPKAKSKIKTINQYQTIYHHQPYANSYQLIANR